MKSPQHKDLHASSYGSIDEICVSEDAGVASVVAALSVRTGPRVGSGIALVLGPSGELVGIITDADLRRGLLKHELADLRAAQLMTTDFVSVKADATSSKDLYEIFSRFGGTKWATENPARAIPILGSNREPLGLMEISGRERESMIQRDVAIVIGQGFVGLTLSVVLSSSGVKTYGIETDRKKLNSLRRGKTEIVDPGLHSGLIRGIRSDNLYFMGSISDLPALELGRRRTFIVTVGTPVISRNPDLSGLFDAIASITTILRKGDLIVLRSTVPVGTTARVAHQLETASGLRVGIDFFVVNAPERTVEGAAMAELRSLPQVVGGVTPRCTTAGLEFFSLFAGTVLPVSTPEFSELVKLASNSFRDYSFAFSNYLAQIASGFGLDANELIRIANLGYGRNQIASPSPGVGGPCLTKDPYMMPVPVCLGHGEGNDLIHQARRFNEEFLQFQAQRLIEIFGNDDPLPVAALGLAFKGIPETNDLRGSTGVILSRILADGGVEIHSWDATIPGKVSGFPRVKTSTAYRGILLLNNHPRNAEMTYQLLEGSGGRSVRVFDPWRLLDASPPENLLGHDLGGLRIVTLSNSYRLA